MSGVGRDLPDQGCAPRGSYHSGLQPHRGQCLSGQHYTHMGSCPSHSEYLSNRAMDVNQVPFGLFPLNSQSYVVMHFLLQVCLLPSPSISMAQASPSPLLSVSIWSGLLSYGQLSQRSPTSSRSWSNCLGLKMNGQLSYLTQKNPLLPETFAQTSLQPDCK